MLQAGSALRRFVASADFVVVKHVFFADGKGRQVRHHHVGAGQMPRSRPSAAAVPRAVVAGSST